MQGVFLDVASLDRNDLDLGPLQASLSEWTMYQCTAARETAQRIAQADVVVSNKVVLGREQLRQAGNLKLICVAATGVNNVDLVAAREMGVAVCNIRDYAAPSVVQHVFALILALRTHLLEYHAAVRQGRWHDSEQFCLLDYPIEEISGSCLGIIGYGVLGKALANLAQAFGMNVLIAEHKGCTEVRSERVLFDEVLAKSDILSLHCPLNAQTQNLIGVDELGKMKNSALLVNAARGGIVDEAALLCALQQGWIGGAGVDVLSVEPPVRDNPLLQQELPNLIVTPHIAWASRQARQRLTDQLVENIKAFVNGQPKNLVGNL